MWISIPGYSVSTPISLATHQMLFADLAAPVVGGEKKTTTRSGAFENRTLDNKKQQKTAKKVAKRLPLANAECFGMLLVPPAPSAHASMGGGERRGESGPITRFAQRKASQLP